MNELQTNELLNAKIETSLDWSWTKDGPIYSSNSTDLQTNLYRFSKAIELGAVYATLTYLNID